MKAMSLQVTVTNMVKALLQVTVTNMVKAFLQVTVTNIHSLTYINPQARAMLLLSTPITVEGACAQMPPVCSLLQ